MPNIEVTPKFEFTWDWFIALLERVFKEVFGFIAKEEKWEDDATAEVK
ncbi:MAG: hypothetical protein IIX36_03990 [Clostridia bacterium]|nr:hypothetical protein [Clostridia bacterium]